MCYPPAVKNIDAPLKSLGAKNRFSGLIDLIQRVGWLLISH
jgi:hypothetical protein